MASSGRLVDYIGGGVAAARPATLNLTPGSIGLYFAVDTKALTIWDGDSWESPAGSGVAWGSITGSIASQTDLADILADKLEDAPSDGQQYVRKDGAWAVASGGGGSYTPKNVFAILLPEVTAMIGDEYARVIVPYAGGLDAAQVTANMGTPPSADFTLYLYKGVSHIGSLIFQTAGTVAKAGFSGATFAAGDTFRVRGETNAACKNVAITVSMT